MLSVQEGKNYIQIKGRTSPSPIGFFYRLIHMFFLFIILNFLIMIISMTIKNVMISLFASGTVIVIITSVAAWCYLGEYFATSCRVDVTKETFRWKENFGKIDKSIYFKEIRELTVVPNIKSYRLKNATFNEDYYRLDAVDERGDSHTIANFKNRTKALDTAEKIGKLSERPVRETVQEFYH